MQELKDEDGKNYISVTDDEIKELPPLTRIYYLDDGKKAIAPPNCEHEFYISSGCPSNIKGCKKCIYWEWA